MNRSRRLGIGLSIVGFVIALLAGIYLAVQVSNGQNEVGSLLATAAVAFVPVAICIGAGLYLYLKNDDQETETFSATRKQRELMDMLRSHGHMTVVQAADALDVTPDQVRELVDDLIHLEIFTGTVDWEAGVLEATDAGQLLDAP